MNLCLFAIAFTPLGFTLVAKLSRAIVGYFLIVITCWIPRAIATKVPCIATLFLAIITSHFKYLLSDNRIRIIPLTKWLSKGITGDRIGVWGKRLLSRPGVQSC